MKPPPLRNDCFAMPPGVDWTPLDEALARLAGALHPVAAVKAVAVSEASRRILAEPCVALRANPAAANAAVDGYAFAADGVTLDGEGAAILPLVLGRAAAGAPFREQVPVGAAIRILTGAVLPEGVDTVVLDEDVTTGHGRVAFRGPLKKGANTRRAGEDFGPGATLLTAGARLRAQDIALLTAAGLSEVRVHARLKVGVLSTGDEVRPAGQTLAPHEVYDANRPMLLALLSEWGMTAVDLGHIGDDREALGRRFDDAARTVDALMTTGGASAGDEDHVSALLSAAGAMSVWRVAIKPGRPLALGLWEGLPIFGLPGNPVAAFVCALVFVAPGLTRLAGGTAREPEGFSVPAAFAKTKRPGRREFLRARLTPDGQAEAFRSEGSGRISGLTFSEGLVELPDGALTVEPGTPVRYIPYAAFAR